MLPAFRRRDGYYGRAQRRPSDPATAMLPAGTRLLSLRHTTELARYSWDEALAPSHFYASTEWLSYVERLHADYRAYAVATSPGGQLLAGLPLHQIDLDVSDFNRVDRRLALALTRSGPSNLAAEHPTAASLAELLIPALALGGRTIGVSAAPTCSCQPNTRRALLEALLAEAEQIARERQLASLSALYVDGRDVSFRAALEARGFIAFPNGGTSALSVTRDGYEGYLTSRRPGRRRQIQREREQVAGAGIRYRSATVTPDLVPRLAALQAQVSRRHGRDISLDEIRANHDLELAHLPGRLEVLLAEDGESRIVASGAFYRWRHMLVTRQLGRDYVATQGLPLYFDYMYQYTDEAARRGASTVDFSTELEDVKRSRGCTVTPLVAYAKALTAGHHAKLTGYVRALPRCSSAMPDS